MKKNFKCLALMAAALLMGFSSCSNDDDNAGSNDNGPKKTVSLKMAKTYAEGAVQKEGDVTFTSGDVYFTDDKGVIRRHLTINKNAKSTTNINMEKLMKDGETITDLPSSVNHVYIVGNTPNLPTAGNISAVQKSVLDVKSQADLAAANLYGDAATEKTADATPTDNAKYKAEITLKPTVSRVELTDMTITGNVITGYKIAGIFIDNYYAAANVDGTTTSTVVNNGADSAPFADNTTQYPSDLSKCIYDWYTKPLEATSNVAKPGLKDGVWGYNLFAGNAVPRIVIRLTGVTADPKSGMVEQYKNDQFITIRAINVAGVPLTSIEAGKIYNIAAGALSFDESYVTPTPNQKLIDVTVTVKLATWTVVDSKPVL